MLTYAARARTTLDSKCEAGEAYVDEGAGPKYALMNTHIHTHTHTHTQLRLRRGVCGRVTRAHVPCSSSAALLCFTLLYSTDVLCFTLLYPALLCFTLLYATAGALLLVLEGGGAGEMSFSATISELDCGAASDAMLSLEKKRKNMCYDDADFLDDKRHSCAWWAEHPQQCRCGCVVWVWVWCGCGCGCTYILSRYYM
jgi:hypothetical protein